MSGLRVALGTTGKTKTHLVEVLAEYEWGCLVISKCKHTSSLGNACETKLINPKILIKYIIIIYIFIYIYTLSTFCKTSFARLWMLKYSL